MQRRLFGGGANQSCSKRVIAPTNALMPKGIFKGIAEATVDDLVDALCKMIPRQKAQSAEALSLGD